tara:strand:- start:48 stop:584 length:537 start_codon:yes stop_codon:yes gene_type:complete
MGIPTLISTATASNAASVDITSGIDSTYDEYMFVFTGMNPATDSTNLLFQVNAADESGFNETITSSWFRAYHMEDDSGADVGYVTGSDQAQGTSYQFLIDVLGNAADESADGVLHLFNPSNTTYVKHFYGTFIANSVYDGTQNAYVAGYINTTAAIDEISFKMTSGNMDGVIQMYGIA